MENNKPTGWSTMTGRAETDDLVKDGNGDVTHMNGKCSSVHWFQ